MPKIRLPFNASKIDLSKIILSSEQKKLFEIVEKSNDHIFITGKAGTGKSALLQYIKQNTKKKHVVVAPTGVAALNVGGQTIHSLFKIPPAFIHQDSLKVDPRVGAILRNLEMVVIDEISMVRADLMDAIDHLLRQARISEDPFGGVQIVMFGDLFQLPPVVNDGELHKYFADNHGGFYFFNAHAFKTTEIKIFELSRIFRQSDERFKELLNLIREGKIDQTTLQQLNIRKTTLPKDGYITLVTTNRAVSEINNKRLEELNEPLFEYLASITGTLEQSAFPAEDILRLKKSAQIMMLKNDRERRWVNGSVGTIHSLSEDEIKVEIDGINYRVTPETWKKIRYYYNRDTHKIEEEIVASFTQFPLKLAWAVTVHKSQGQTYSCVVLDLGEGAFAHGQTYVALSRCKDLDGLYLTREIDREDIIVDPDVISFMKRATILSV